jgi:threonine/homoserine/homoserine lactone efflux protein
MIDATVLALAHGLAVGFFISAVSYGPLFFIFARTTLAYGRILGFFSGLGIAVGDAIATAVAVLGLSFISDFLDVQRIWLSLGGGLILCAVGVRLARVKPPETIRPPTVTTLAGAFISTLGLTLMTPSGIPYIAGIFAIFGVPIGSASLEAVLYLALGVFVGATILRVVQTLILDAARGRLAPRVLRLASLTAAVVLIGAGVFAIGTGVFEYTQRG